MDTVALQSFYDGYSLDSYNIFGAHIESDGVRFRVYAPNAKSVRLTGDFNKWAKDQCFFMKSTFGFWEYFAKGMKEFDTYKYIIETQKGKLLEKVDPYGFYNELRPGWCNKVVSLDTYKFTDEQWMNQRSRNFDKPLNIYEVHLGGFKHNAEDKWLTYYEMIDELIPYVKEMGYTHIELLPLNEHAFDGSWGYQQYGYFSVTSRYGSPYQLQMFIDACHKNGIGVIIDVVIAHFIKDSFALGKFDGGVVYESADPKLAESEWGTYYFDFSKNIVKSFLMSSLGLWFDKYHMDGIRVDAVSNLIYYQGKKAMGENRDAISFLKRMNYHMHQKYPTVMTIAEDSSDYPHVTGDSQYGLGFDYKWDLGWMNDTLKYYHEDPEFRHNDHNRINFSMAYFYNEKYIMPFSHDEVVHSKLTLVDKMFGSYEDKFRQARNLMVYMYTHPGKKLNFMGNEFASFREFDEAKQLDWFMMKYPNHDSYKRLCRDLNLLYKAEPAFWKFDYDPIGYKWIDPDNSTQRIYSYIRFAETKCYVIILNMSPVSYENYEIGVPTYGYFTEVINSEKDIYGGCNMCNFKKVVARKGNFHGFKYKINIRLAPYAGVIFEAKLR